MTYKEKIEQKAQEYTDEFVRNNKDVNAKDIKDSYIAGAEEDHDLLVKKSLRWYCLDCDCNDNCRADHRCYFVNDYKEYIDGEHNTLPPKGDGLRFKRFRLTLSKDIERWLRNNLEFYIHFGENDKMYINYDSLFYALQKYTNERLVF